MGVSPLLISVDLPPSDPDRLVDPVSSPLQRLQDRTEGGLLLHRCQREQGHHLDWPDSLRGLLCTRALVGSDFPLADLTPRCSLSTSRTPRSTFREPRWLSLVSRRVSSDSFVDEEGAKRVRGYPSPVFLGDGRRGDLLASLVGSSARGCEPAILSARALPSSVLSFRAYADPSLDPNSQGPQRPRRLHRGRHQVESLNTSLLDLFSFFGCPSFFFRSTLYIPFRCLATDHSLFCLGETEREKLPVARRSG